LQQAVSRALGVNASQLAYYAVQQAQLPELLLLQQQPASAALPQQQQKLARSSSSSGTGSSSGNGRPRSRGPSPLRGSSSGSSGGKAQQPSLLQQQQQGQQGVSVVVGFKDGNCGFSLGKLEELLQGAAAEASAAEKLRLANQQLQVCAVQGSSEGGLRRKEEGVARGWGAVSWLAGLGSSLPALCRPLR
jgi:hypothetical protein